MNPVHADYVPLLSRGRGRTNLANPTLLAPATAILPQALMPKVMTFTGIPTPALWKPAVTSPRELRRPLGHSPTDATSPIDERRHPTPPSHQSPASFVPQPSVKWSTVTEDRPALGERLGDGYGRAMAGAGRDAGDDALRLYQDAAGADLSGGGGGGAEGPAAAANQLAALRLSAASQSRGPVPSEQTFPPTPTPAFSPQASSNQPPTPGSASKNPYKWVRPEQRTAPAETSSAMTRSTLSADAKEFVPRPRPSTETEEAYRPVYKKSGPAARPASTPESRADAAVWTLGSAMNAMSRDPAAFHRESPALVQAFGGWLSDADVSNAVVSALLERGVADANFRFNGARLCAALSAQYGAHFQNFLVDSVRTEHERCSSAPSPSAHAQGFVAFAADLFATVETAPGSRRRLPALGRVVLEALAALVAGPPNEQDVKCACHALKLAGYHLESCDATALDAILQRLGELCADARAPALARTLVEKLFAQRAANWGIGGADAAQTQTQTTTQMLDPGLNEPTFYGPDGAVLSSEESEFLQQQFSAGSSEDGDHEMFPDENIWVEDEEMDEEIQAAFEQFLLLNKQK